LWHGKPESQSQNSCECSAVTYSFIEQVRWNGLDPFAYFKWVIERLREMIKQDQAAINAISLGSMPDWLCGPFA